MAAVTTNMANLAISNLGIGIEIQDLDTDTTPEAKACRRYFDETIRAVLGDFDWPFTRKFFNLNLIEECPTTEWAYSYRYPSDCLHFRRILPTNNAADATFYLPGTTPVRSSRIETRQSRVPYIIGKDVGGKLLYTDMEAAIAEYTEFVTDPNFYPSDFIMAFSFRLAAYIAPRITRGDPFKMRMEMLQQYKLELSVASANALNEEQPDENPDSEFQRARE